MSKYYEIEMVGAYSAILELVEDEYDDDEASKDEVKGDVLSLMSKLGYKNIDYKKLLSSFDYYWNSDDPKHNLYVLDSYLNDYEHLYERKKNRKVEYDVELAGTLLNLQEIFESDLGDSEQDVENNDKILVEAFKRLGYTVDDYKKAQNDIEYFMMEDEEEAIYDAEGYLADYEYLREAFLNGEFDV
jgi:Holliday junction resolvasome RuvABC DNA-binding subunit